MKVFSQVSTIPGGPVKQKLVVCCSHKRTAAQYLAIYIQIAKPLLGSYITVGDTKKVAKRIPITPERVGKHKKRGDWGYISYFALPPLRLASISIVVVGEFTCTQHRYACGHAVACQSSILT